VDLALREQVRVLKTGGRLLIFDGNLLNPLTLADLLLFYPLRSRGRHGGLKWLFAKGKLRRDLNPGLPLGRDEDIKTPAWWRARIRREPRMRLIQAASGGHFAYPGLPGFLRTFLGCCVVVAEKA